MNMSVCFLSWSGRHFFQVLDVKNVFKNNLDRLQSRENSALINAKDFFGEYVIKNFIKIAFHIKLSTWFKIILDITKL